LHLDWTAESGADPYSRRCVMFERENLTAESIPELIEKIGKRYGIDIDDVFLPGDEEDEIESLGFNQFEDADGNAEDDEPQYIADYTFGVEKRTIAPVTAADFAAAGIKTH
jgi:hypothetical protein